MKTFLEGWRIQRRVIGALMMRELQTRHGRDNIGFLWVMGEPALFALTVTFLFNIIKGHSEHGISVTAFTISGYLPITLFRHAVTRCVWVFRANAGLLYHRPIKILDLVLVRFLIEVAGSLMAYLFIAVPFMAFDLFPVPYDMANFLYGMLLFCLFTLGLCLILAPLSEMNELVEKFIPVSTYIMVPLSGAFFMVSWFPAWSHPYLMWSPPINMFEMMRYGLFGNKITPNFTYIYPLVISLLMIVFGLALCRRVRAHLVVE